MPHLPFKTLLTRPLADASKVLQRLKWICRSSEPLKYTDRHIFIWHFRNVFICLFIYLFVFSLLSPLCANVSIECGAAGAVEAYSSPPLRTHISCQARSIKYSQASSAELRSFQTCCRVPRLLQLVPEMKIPHPSGERQSGGGSSTHLAAGITSDLFGSGCRAFLMCFCRMEIASCKTA